MIGKKMLPQSLEFLEIEGDGKIDASIIWLHGLGADGYDFEPVVEALALSDIRFILPHAPLQPVSINNGCTMPAWYDILGLDAASPQDETGIRRSQQRIESLLEQELARGIASDRIMLAGFSQGGAVALHTAFRYSQKLAGVLGLSTYLPLRTKLAAEAHEANRNIPVFMAHGFYDNVISLNTGRIAATSLQELGYSVEWHEYSMAHSVCQEEIDDVRRFIIKALEA